MRETDHKSARPPDPDVLFAAVAGYVCSDSPASAASCETARHCLMDSLACGFDALASPACTALLGPVVPGATMAGGARVPGTSYELDPVRAAMNIGTMVSWLGINDPALAAGWGHPADNLGGILAVADYLGRKAVAEGKAPPTIRALLTAMIKAHQVQGVIALETGLDRLEFESAVMVRVASTAVVTTMLGGAHEQVIDAISSAWHEGGGQRSHGAAAGSAPRGRWAAGDATSRAVWHAINALRRAPGPGECPTGDAASGSARGRYSGTVVQAYFEDSGKAGRTLAGVPIQHRRLRVERVDALRAQFGRSIAGVFPAAQRERIKAMFADTPRLDAMPVNEFVAQFARN